MKLDRSFGRILAVIGMCGAAMLSTRSAHAKLIDNFDTDPVSVSATAGNSDSAGVAVGGGNAIGGFRQLDIPGGTPVTGLKLSLDADPANSGFLAFSLDATSSGSGFITWDANGAGLNNPVGEDLTDAGASTFFSFDILSIDQGFVDLIVTVTDINNNVATRTLTPGSAGTQQFLFSSFANFGSTDFASVKSVKLEIQGTNASDMTLDQIFTSGPEGAPEPSTWALGLVGLVGLGMVAYRRRRA